MMNNLAAMYSEMDAEGITIVEYPMKKHKSVCLEKGKMVGVDPQKFDTGAELCAALIHEEGHFTSGAFYTPYSPYQVKAQAEERANRAAFKKRIPLEALREQMDRARSVWEIADYFNVTAECVWNAYLYYRDVVGVKFE